MSWFKVDDTAHSHRKLRSAGAAAIGLWTLGGSYAGQYLTDGIVHAHFVKTTGTPPQVARLVKAGLWHPAGHTCTGSRCRVQPDEGDFLMHDYLEYNRSRAQVLAERDRAAEKKRKQRAAGANPDGIESDSSSNRDGIEEESTPNEPYINPVKNQESAGQGDLSPGDSLGTSRARVNPTRPDPSVPSPTEKEQTQKPAGYEEPARIGDRPRIPINCQPLVAALQREQLYVGWDLKPTDWFVIEALIKRCGISALVVSARGSWQGAKTQPRSGTYFLPAWRQMSDTFEEPAGEMPDQGALPAAVGAEVIQYGPRPHQAAAKPSTTDQRVNAALDLGRRMQAARNQAQENQ
ncbi:mucin-2 [Streptomyces sp. NBC_01565]|uniref:mucin-2 n=1 Tax=Streptomyces sp. NBC_01565 TaxID=2975881 RepID=UPI0022533CCE|nr:mucin-2 [Streptomyces sp. NBC_01565]MCX4543824.1 mucin-2 [Streptomyces sp. NBC_01565]